MNNLAGRTAFITGAANGIGLGIARALAKAGVQVALTDIDAGALDAARAELESITNATAVVLDVRDRDAFAAAADQVEAELGPVSVLCNNAGVAGYVLPEMVTYDDWDWVYGININGVVNGIQTFLPRMISRGGDSHIVNTASGAGLVAVGTGFLYSSSKFAVVGLSESLHHDLMSHNIGVSVLCPGRVATAIMENTEGLRPGDGLPDVLRESMLAAGESLQTGTSPDVVGEMVVTAIRAGQVHILTDNTINDAIQARTEAILSAAPDRVAG